MKKSETHENNPRTGEKDISQTALSKLSKRQKEPSSSSKGKKQNQDEKHSIEALLSVPLKYILRKTTKGRNQHQQLLSKTEATAFLQISNLAYELDILVHMATSALYKSHLANQLSTSIITLSSSYSSSLSYYSYYHHYLQPIHVLLKIHGETIPHQILQHVQTNMERILLVEFPVLSQILHQSSEQNWSVSNAFGDDSDDDDDDSDDDADNDNESGSGNGNSNGGGKHTKKKKKKHKSNVNQLGREKGILAELEEEVCKRMNGLIEMANMDHAGGAGVSDGVNGQSNDYDDNASNMDVDMDDTTDRDIFDLMTAPKYKKEEGENSGGDDDDDKQFMSMARLCQNLFNDRDTKNGLQHDSHGKNWNVV